MKVAVMPGFLLGKDYLLLFDPLNFPDNIFRIVIILVHPFIVLALCGVTAIMYYFLLEKFFHHFMNREKYKTIWSVGLLVIVIGTHLNLTGGVG